MPLLDQYGRPVRTREITREIAAPSVASVRQAWTGSMAAGLTPRRLAGLLSAADQGDIASYLIFAEEMEERDPHYASVMGVRKRAVSGVEPVVTAAADDARSKQIADAVRSRIAEASWFSDLVEDLLDGLGKGFAVVEIDWARTAAAWWPRGVSRRDPRFFMPDRETGEQLRLIDEAAPGEGIDLEPMKFIVHRPRLKSGMAIRGGIARLVGFSWMCKAYALKDWMAFAETYGLPLRVGRYGPEATKEDVDVLYRAVANIGSDAAAVIPRSVAIEFEQSGVNAGEAVFENLARYLDEQISKAVLGQTMTTDNGSSMAQAEVHNEVRHDVASADARGVTATILRDLVIPFVDLNWGPQEAYPELTIPIAEPEDVDMILQNVDRLVQRGVRIKASELRGKLGFSEPDDGDEVIGGAPEAKLPAPRPPRAALAREAEEAGPWEVLGEIEAEMLSGWEDVMSSLLGPIEAAIAAASSYEDAAARLSELDTAGAPAELIDVLVRGMVKARGFGDATDG